MPVGRALCGHYSNLLRPDLAQQPSAVGLEHVSVELSGGGRASSGLTDRRRREQVDRVEDDNSGVERHTPSRVYETSSFTLDKAVEY